MMQTEISLDSTVVASRNQATADLKGEVVILNLKDGVYYSLNALGAKIWSQVQEPRVVAAVRDDVVAKFPEVDPDHCTRDTLAYLKQLADAGLIEVLPRQ